MQHPVDRLPFSMPDFWRPSESAGQPAEGCSLLPCVLVTCRQDAGNGANPAAKHHSVAGSSINCGSYTTVCPLGGEASARCWHAQKILACVESKYSLCSAQHTSYIPLSSMQGLSWACWDWFKLCGIVPSVPGVV